MANTPPLLPRDEGSAEADRTDVLRQAAPIRTAAFTALVACAFLLVVAVVGLGQLDHSEPGFLSDALGPEESGAPLDRTPAPGVGVRIHSEGYTITRWGDSVSLVGEDVGGAEWRSHVHGVTRTTDFGAETIIVDGTRTEEFFTVTSRQGERTWRWKLGTRLVPRLGRDGSVSFLDPTRRRVSGLVVDPVRILDEDGRDVTPDGLRWGLEEQGSSWWVTLELDDRDLPLPYVIDPAVTYRDAQTATTAGATSLVINVPAGVQANDLLVAHIARTGNAAINTPSGWTAAGGTNNGNFIRQATYYRVASGSEPASYTWTWTGSQPAAGGMSAYYGVKGTSPLDVVGTATTSNNTTSITAPGLTTTTDDALVLAFFASNSNSTYSTAAGMTERHEAATTGMSLATDDMSQATAGATGNKTSTATASGRVVGHQVSFNVDDVAPTAAQTDPGSPLAGTVALNGTANDQDSAVGQVQFQRSPAGAGTWTDVGAADTTSPYSASFDTTGVTDGLYDVRAVATDVAGNTGTSTAVTNRRVDNTAPSSTTSFPAASTTYSASGWNAGCGTSGLCGTHSDAGSGVQSVQVSLRQGSGNYWNGTAFASASEVWNTTSLAGGNWSYAFAAASFPADGSYTVRVQATDAAGNVQAPASRTFTIDTTAPQTTIGSNPTDPTAATSADFAFSASEGGSSFECRIDAGSWGACTSPKSYTSLSDGSHTFDVRATDAVGNQDASPASFTWTVDAAAPTSTTSFPAAGGEYNAAGWDAGCATSGLCGTHSDGSGSGVTAVEVSVRRGSGNYWNGSAFASASEVWNAATLGGGTWSLALDSPDFPADGDYTVRVRAVDAVANTQTPSSRTFTYDGTNPSALLSFPAASGDYTNATWDAGCATSGFCGTTSDGAGSGVQSVQVSVRRVSSGQYWNGTGFSSGSEVFHAATVAGGNWSYGFDSADFPADGDYTVHARATDDAGNTESGPSRTFRIDNAAPSSTTSFPASSGTYSTAAWNAGCATTGLCGTYGDGSGSGVAQVQVSLRQGSGNYWNGTAFASASEVWNAVTLAAGDWSLAFAAASFPADGGYTVRVRATDAAGNVEAANSRSFTIDRTAPQTTIDSSPSDPSASGGASFDFSSSEGGSSFECRIDGGSWGACTSPESYAGLADASHTFDVRATDGAGNQDVSPASFTWLVDTTAPTSSTAFPAASGSYTAAEWDAGCTTAGLCGTYGDGTGSGVAEVEVSVRRGTGNYWDGSAFSSATEVWNDAGLAAGDWSYAFDSSDFPADGSYTVRVRAADAAANTQTPSSRTFTFDATAPASTTTFPAAAGDYNTAGWNAGCPASGLCGTYSDGAGSGVADVEVSIRQGTGDYWDGSGFTNASEVWNAATLAAGDWSYAFPASSFPANGAYTVRVRAVDDAGNAETAASRTFTVDTTAPQTTIDSSPADPTSSTGASFDLTASEGGSTFECRLDGGAWGACTSPKSYASLADGSHTFDVRATDSAGNTDATPASFTWLVDTTAPGSTTSFPAPAGEYDTAGWNAGCATSGLCGTYSDGVGSGVQTVEVSIRRGSGNYWDGSAFSSATEDWNAAALSAGDWSYALDAADFPADGSYTVRVRATDDAGNVETPSTRTFDLDTIDPAALHSFPAASGEYNAAGWNAGCATTGFCGTHSDATSGVAGVEISVKRVSSDLYWDGDSFDAAGETFFAAALSGGDWSYAFPAAGFPADGQYTVHVRATDDAGNTEGGPSRTFRIDDTDPSAAYGFPASGGTYDVAGWDAGCPAAGLCGTAADGGSGVAQVEISLKRVGADLYWDGDSFDAAGETFFAASFAAGSWSWGFDGADFPADGAYTAHVRASDGAGNVETGPVRTFTIDTAAPQTTIDSSPADPTTSASADFDFSASEGGSSFECRLDGGAWGACTSPKSYASLADGSHTFDVRATDAAGNQDPTPASFTWTVDTTAPGSTTSFPAASGEYNASGWNGGCAAAGLCGTYGDGAGGSGVAEVEVSIRRGAGNYWNGTGFSSATEVWNAAGLAAGEWQYDFDASDFPADGGYAIRVRATDEAGNAESPASRTFAYDDTAPTGSLTAPAEGAAVRGAAVAISSDSADSGAGVASAEFQRRPAGGGAWTPVDTDTTAPYSVAWDTTALGDGDYDLRVLTTDEAGNSLASAMRTVAVDNTAPSSATLDALPAALRNGFELSGSAADAGSGVDTLAYLYCEGTSCTPSAPIGSSTTGPGYDVTWSSQPADGDVRVLARATDRAGNTLDSAVQTALVDNTSPTGALTAPADGALLTGTAAVSSDSADSGSGVASAEFQRRPAGGGAWTTIDTDASAPYSVAWDTTSLTDGDYDLRVLTTDEAGNGFTSAARTVTVDNTAPSVALTAPAGFVNGASPDPFTVTASTPDGDVDEVEFFSCSNASAGCAGGSWVSLGADASAPYSASWPVDADGNRALRAVATDGSSNTGEDTTDVIIDRTDPTGALTAPADGALLTATVAVSSDSADGGSGIDEATFGRRPAGGGAWTAVGSDATAPYSVSWDTAALADGDYDLRVVTTDVAGNTFASAPRTVTVDNSAPSAPVVTLSESSPFAHVAGTEIFVNAAETGTYDVDATASDAHSGIDKVRFPGPTDDSSSPYGASYDLDDLAGGQTVTSFNGVGLTAASPFTVTPDTAGPAGGSVSYADGYDADGDVPVTVDAGTDALSGLAPGTAVLERRTAPLAGGSCDPFAGAWSPVTSPDTVASGLCAQYRYRVSDRVGNETVYGSGDVVKVDLAAPSAPVLTLDESSPFAYVAGTEIFLNTAETGSYDVDAAVSDPLAGIDKVAFPGGIDDTSAPYTATYDFDDLAGTETVTAHDRAGNTAGSDFEVTEDVGAPSTTDDTATIGSAWQSAPVTVTLSPSDARSGVAATYYTTDGSVPTTASNEGTSIDLTADGVYTIRYFSVDNVGNAEPVRTAFDDIRIDRTNPAAPSITLSESSPFAYASGDEILVNTGQAGTYDVEATSSDGGSGLEKLAFPGGAEDTTSPYSASYAFGDLAGVQTVTAHDLAGHTASDTFTVTPDTTAPAGGFVSYPDGYDADGVVTVTVDAGSDALAGLDAGSAVLERQTTPLAAGACDPFTGGWSAVTSPDTVPGNTCARYRYRVSDRVGNEAVYTLPASVVKVDLAAPQTTIDSAPADPSADASPSFAFSASEGGSTFECRLDGGAWTACTSPESLAGIADGSHTFAVGATDGGGNTDPTPASHTWTVDTDAPETTLDSAPADPSTEDTPSFAFSADEAGATFECRVDGGAWAPCSSPEPAGPLADGPHTFDVRATDEAGNTDATPGQHAWTVDTTAPETTLDTTPSDPSNDPTPDFEFSADEPGSTFQCRLDGGTWVPCTSPAAIGPLADGPHTLDVRATDPAGNVDATPAQHAWNVNAVAPTVTIVQPSGFVNAADSDPYTVRATSPDGDLTGIEFFRCSDASTACATGSWASLGTDATAPYEASWPLDADGGRALRAVATDAGSNTGEDVVTVTIDRTVPATSIDSAPSDPSPSGAAVFAFSANEGGATFECRLDGGSWTACTSPESYAGLADGGHSFDVRAADAAGNVDATPATFSWTVDTAAPETTIVTAPADPSPSSAPAFEFSSSEGGSTFECRLDGGAWTACTSPESLAGLADGSHTFQVRATDASGTTDPTPASHTWTVDATPPGGGLADPGQYLRGTIALGASPTDTGAGVQSVEFQLSPADAGAWTSIDVDASDPYGVSWDTTGESDGLYDLRVLVTDNAGNVTASALVEDRLVDNTAPGAAMDDPGAYLRATVALTSSMSDAGSGVASVAYQRSAAGAGLLGSGRRLLGHDRGRRRPLRPARGRDRQRRQLDHLRPGRRPARGQHQAEPLLDRPRRRDDGRRRRHARGRGRRGRRRDRERRARRRPGTGADGRRRHRDLTRRPSPTARTLSRASSRTSPATGRRSASTSRCGRARPPTIPMSRRTPSPARRSHCARRATRRR